MVSTPEQEARGAERMRELELRRAVDAVRNCDIPGFFPTPTTVIDRMLGLVNLRDDLVILEPSAGLGDIIHQVKLRYNCTIDAYETNSSLCNILKLKGYHATQQDFLTVEPTAKYDLVLMNPPFERKGGVKHVLHAYKFLKPGGGLVAVVPPNQADEIGESLDIKKGSEIPPRAFANADAFRQTGVNVCIIVIEKVEAKEPTITARFAAPDEDEFCLAREVVK